MRSRSLLFGAALALTVPLLAAAPAGAILGGHASTQAYSFMGSFQPAFPAPPRPDGHGCGVTVLAPQWVLTASHCAGRNPTGARNGVPRGWRVRIGSLDTTSGGEVADVDHYYRLATSSDDGGFWGKDVALLHLRHPVRARPARIAAATPPEGAPVRILGWGMSCEDSGDPACFPTELREADTVVQPLSVCPVAGVVSGPGGDRAPTLYTDVTRHAAWINGIISGTRVPPDDRIPDVEGAVDLGGCVGSVVSTPASRPRDPALLLPHGHCVTAARPAPGTALVDQPADRAVPIAGHQGYPRAVTHANRLMYATMTGTDVALYRLDRTYAQLKAAGAKVFRLTTTPVRAGDPLTIAYSGFRLGCTAEAVVAHLREGGTTVVGIHNTHNDSGDGAPTTTPARWPRTGLSRRWPDVATASRSTGSRRAWPKDQNWRCPGRAARSPGLGADRPYRRGADFAGHGTTR